MITFFKSIDKIKKIINVKNLTEKIQLTGKETYLSETSPLK